MTTRDSAELQRLIRAWIAMGYSRRAAESEAREEQRVSRVWRSRGWSQADVNQALAHLRAQRDVFIVDARGRKRPANPGPSIFSQGRRERNKGGG